MVYSSSIEGGSILEVNKVLNSNSIIQEKNVSTISNGKVPLISKIAYGM